MSVAAQTNNARHVCDPHAEDEGATEGAGGCAADETGSEVEAGAPWKRSRVGVTGVWTYWDDGPRTTAGDFVQALCGHALALFPEFAAGWVGVERDDTGETEPAPSRRPARVVEVVVPQLGQDRRHRGLLLSIVPGSPSERKANTTAGCVCAHVGGVGEGVAKGKVAHYM